jgi:hypothetical protein
MRILSMVRNIVALITFLVAANPLWAGAIPADVREGDIIFQASLSSQSIAVQRATGSPYSHMGIILFRDGKPYVLEAIGTVQYTPLKAWIARGDGGHFVIKRLKDADRVLTPAAMAKLRKVAATFAGKPYDPTFRWSDARIYCSELVWKIYDRGVGVRIGRLQRFRDFKLDDPAVQAKIRQRYGKAVPMNEKVISPGEMFSFNGLITVAEG